MFYTQFWYGPNVELVTETCFWMVEYHLYSVALLVSSPFVLYLDMFSCAQFSGCVSVTMLLRQFPTHVDRLFVLYIFHIARRKKSK